MADSTKILGMAHPRVHSKKLGDDNRESSAKPAALPAAIEKRKKGIGPKYEKSSKHDAIASNLFELVKQSLV